MNETNDLYSPVFRTGTESTFAASGVRQSPTRQSAFCRMIVCTAVWAGTWATGAVAVPHFSDVTKEAGIDHRHYQPVLDQKLGNIMSWVTSVGAAAAAGDFNNDGNIDLYITNSRKGKPNRLYRNNGNGTFTDVAPKAGLADVNGKLGTSMDCVWGDYDNDGWVDLYLLRWGKDSLFRNQGDGTFVDVSEKLFRQRDGSPGTDWANGNGVIFMDYDLDGRLDIYVGNYFREQDLWNLKDTRIMHDDFEKARNGGTNFMYHQKPDGTFEQVAEKLGLDDPGWTLAVGSADINNDGYPDLYCADDFGPDQLFANKGNGTFENITESAIGFDTKKGMNVDFGDFNNDGWMDAYVTNITTAEYLQEGNMLWHNNGLDAKGNATMIDVALETGTFDGGWGWCGKFLDFDNDADLDIITVNGFISAGKGDYWYDLASWTVTESFAGDAANWPAIGNRSFSGYETTRMFQNDGFFSFNENAKDLGIDSNRDGRGIVVFDYDNDGDLDVFLANQNAEPQLFRNNNPGNHRGVLLQLKPNTALGVNRDGVGTRITLVSENGMQIRERDGGNGYSGQSDPRIHFGLGRYRAAKLIEVRWPDGGLQYLENVPGGRITVVEQDPSRYAAQMAIKVDAPEQWQKPKDAPRELSVDREKVETMVAQLENKLREQADGHHMTSLYRSHCRSIDAHDRAVRFLRKLSDKQSQNNDLKIELACAYVDKIPTCGGLAAIVSKGSLANKAINVLNDVIEENPKNWLALYCRAMNHLHWPRALRHSDDAVADFQKCLDLQQVNGATAEKSYHVRTYLGLGDAYAKMKSYTEARRAWNDGLRLFPQDPGLNRRLGITDDDKLFDFVMEQRSLENPIDSDLTFIYEG